MYLAISPRVDVFQMHFRRFQNDNIHRRTRSRIVGSEATNGLEALVTTKFPQVEKSAHPMKVLLETSDFPFFISHCCRTCLDEVIALQ